MTSLVGIKSKVFGDFKDFYKENYLQQLGKMKEAIFGHFFTNDLKLPTRIFLGNTFLMMEALRRTFFLHGREF